MSNIRSEEEAWDLVVENPRVVTFTVSKFVRSHWLPWYTSHDMFEELLSHGWEGMYKACLKWDESKSKLTTYGTAAVWNTCIREFGRMMKMGGSLRTNPLVDKREGLPKLTSLESTEEYRSDKNLFDGGDILRDYFPQPWQEAYLPSAEDEAIDKLFAEEKANETLRLISELDEPWKTMITLRSEGLTMKQIAVKVGRNKETVTNRVREAEEYLENQLRAGGLWE